MRALALAAVPIGAALIVAGCGGGGESIASGRYLVARGDRRVLDDTYGLMLDAATDSDTVPEGATTGERMLYVTFFVDDEIANGGLYQVYWNLPGRFIEEAVRYADALGAHHWAGLVRRAGDRLFPNGVPNDVDAQRKAIGCPDYCDKGSVDRLSDAWRDGELRRPLLRYVRGHPAEFYVR